MALTNMSVYSCILFKENVITPLLGVGMEVAM